MIGASLPGTGTVVALALGALAVCVALAALIRRHPDALALLAIGALPFRLPISADGRTVNLLVPLYLVVGAGVLARVADLLARRRDQAPVPGASADRLLSDLQRVLVAVVVLYALQLTYSPDRAKAAENLGFFYVPFLALFWLMRDVRWTPALLRRCLLLAALLAVVFAGVGFVEYSRKSLFWNPKVVAANQYDNYFRVNSVFFDPSIYGRFLALVMVALATVVLWGRRREVQLGAAVLAWLMAGLVTSFSQSSIAALLLGLAVLAAWRWDVRRTAYVAGVLVTAGLVLLLAAPTSLHFGLKGASGSTSNATSGRASLVSGGLELFADRPLWGYGSGSFETEYKRHERATSENATSASHTIPITVAAEQGAIGLALYVALLTLAFLVLFRGAGRSPPRIALAAAFTALVAHTWTYADFLEDPTTWVLLGVGVALARAAREESCASI